MEADNSSRSLKIHRPNLSVPQEIVEDILSRLPVVSLLKFRCVSKSWRSLIDSDRFIKIHLKRSTKNPSFSHHRVIFRSRNTLISKCNWPSLVEESIVDGFEFNKKVKLVGCCNGVVCLLDGRGIFTLWNPSTRMSFDLPVRPTSIMYLGGGDFRMYGFGYDDLSDDYKVFVIMTPNSYQSRLSTPVGRVYSLTNCTWETLEASIYPHGKDKSGKFVSGKLHWFGYNDDCKSEEDDEDWEDEDQDKEEAEEEDDDCEIVTFDLKNDSYGIVEQPCCLNYSGAQTRTLGVIDGCLSVLCSYPDSHFNIWVMKDYGVSESWINLYALSSFNHPPLREQMVRSFCSRPNREVLIIYKSTLMIYFYNPEDGVFNNVRIINIDGVVGEGVYVESLVSLGPEAEADTDAADAKANADAEEDDDDDAEAEEENS